jgi:hypothetical protein
VEDSESEEEVGRGGAVVRRRGVREDALALAPRRKKTRVESSGQGVVVDGLKGLVVAGGGSVGLDEGGKTGEGDVVMGGVVEEVKKGTTNGAPQGATPEQAAGEKKRKRKNKKKKRKGTDGAAGVEAESEAKGEDEE